MAKTLKKGPIFTADAPAFVVNRLLTRFMGEIIAAIDEGTDPAVADGALAPLGLPMTPIMLLQLVGPAVALHVTETLHGAYPDRFTVSDNLRRIVEAGHRTLVSWTETGEAAHSVPRTSPSSGSRATQPSTAEQVARPGVGCDGHEARFDVDEKVVAACGGHRQSLLTGAGWPFWLGGITPYLDREGIADRVVGRRFNPAGVSTPPSRRWVGTLPDLVLMLQLAV